MYAIGPSRHFAASQQFGRFRSEADISERFAEGIYEYTPWCGGFEFPISSPQSLVGNSNPQAALESIDFASAPYDSEFRQAPAAN